MGDAFAGKVVLITGASSGIGAELARQLAREGAHIAAAARREERLRDLVSEIDRMGRQAIAVRCDVTQPGDCRRAVEETVERFGAVDVAVANAGFGVAGPLEKLSVEDYRRQMETNFFGVLETIYACLPEVKKARGSIVLIGSVAGHIAIPGNSAYAASKFAITGLAGSIRQELAPHGVAVTLISPGFVKSEISQVDNRGVHHASAKDKRPDWLLAETEPAVRAIVRAIRRRKAHAVITGHGKVAVFLQRHTPWLVETALSFGPRARGEPDGATS